MEALRDTIKKLAQQVSDSNEISPESLDLLQSQFTETLNAIKSKIEVANLVNKLISYSCPTDRVQDNGIALNCDELTKFNFTCLLLKVLLQPICDKRFFDIDLSESLDSSSLLNLILLHFDSSPELALSLTKFVTKFDCNILKFEKIIEIFRKSIPLRSDSSFIDLKNEILFTLCNLSAENRNFYQFHEFFIQASNYIEFDDVLFEQKFERTYSEKVFELNWATILKIWKLFVNNFDYSKYGQIKLFAWFLLHIKMDNNIIEQNRTTISKMLNATETLIQDFSLKEERALSIYHSLACLKFLINSHDNSFGDNLPEATLSLSDLSDIFAGTNSKQWERIYNEFETLLDEQKLLFLKLMIIKYKFMRLTRCDEGSFDKLWKGPISKIITNSSLIQFDILHFILTESDYKTNNVLLEYMFENLFDQEMVMNPHICQIFSCCTIWEKAGFQSMFITAFLKRLSLFLSHSKRKSLKDTTGPVFLQNLISNEKLWIKYETILPDSSDPKHEKILTLIKSDCDNFQTTDSHSQQIDSNKMQIILKLLTLFCECVPLEHLYPLNQVRSILFFSSLLVAIKTKAQQDRLTLAKLFVRTNLRVWDSFRSIWLFDFLSPSYYIYQMLYHLQTTLDHQCYELFNCYVKNMFRMFNCTQTKSNIETLIETLNENAQQIRVEYIFMMQTMVLRNNTQFSKKIANNSKFEEHREEFEQIDKSISALIYKNIKIYLMESEAFDGLDSEFVVEGLTKLFEYKVITSLAHTDEPKLKSKWRKLLIKFVDISLQNLASSSVKKSFIDFLQVIVDNRDKLQVALPENLVLDLWHRICHSKVEASDSKLFKKISSLSHWKKVYHSEKIRMKFSKLLSADIDINKQNFKDNAESYSTQLKTIRQLVISIAESSTTEEFTQVVESCTEQLCHASITQSVYVLQLFLLLLKANINQQKSRILTNYSVPILTSLMNLSFCCNKPFYRDDAQIQSHVHLAALELAKVLLSQLLTHNLLRNSHIFQVYSLCVESNLVYFTSDLSLYIRFFQLMNDILHELIVRRSHLAIFSMCSQLNLLSTMLITLLKASTEANFANATEHERIGLENCSKSFAQILTQLSNIEDFKPYALHLIAHYLHHSPDYSLVQMVKKNLTLGIFNLIDFIKDKEMIERFYSRLNQGSREVMKVLLEQYDKYHRFKGYV